MKFFPNIVHNICLLLNKTINLNFEVQLPFQRTVALTFSQRSTIFFVYVLISYKLISFPAEQLKKESVQRNKNENRSNEI